MYTTRSCVETFAWPKSLALLSRKGQAMPVYTDAQRAAARAALRSSAAAAPLTSEAAIVVAIEELYSSDHFPAGFVAENVGPQLLALIKQITETGHFNPQALIADNAVASIASGNTPAPAAALGSARSNGTSSSASPARQLVDEHVDKLQQTGFDLLNLKAFLTGMDRLIGLPTAQQLGRIKFASEVFGAPEDPNHELAVSDSGVPAFRVRATELMARLGKFVQLFGTTNMADIDRLTADQKAGIKLFADPRVVIDPVTGLPTSHKVQKAIDNALGHVSKNGDIIEVDINRSTGMDRDAVKLLFVRP
jgi:hypothetical protein